MCFNLGRPDDPELLCQANGLKILICVATNADIVARSPLSFSSSFFFFCRFVFCFFLFYDDMI